MVIDRKTWEEVAVGSFLIALLGWIVWHGVGLQSTGPVNQQSSVDLPAAGSAVGVTTPALSYQPPMALGIPAVTLPGPGGGSGQEPGHGGSDCSGCSGCSGGGCINSLVQQVPGSVSQILAYGNQARQAIQNAGNATIAQMGSIAQGSLGPFVDVTIAGG